MANTWSGGKLRAVRSWLGLSQMDMVRWFGWNRQAIRRWEGDILAVPSWVQAALTELAGSIPEIEAMLWDEARDGTLIVCEYPTTSDKRRTGYPLPLIRVVAGRLAFENDVHVEEIAP